MGAKNLIEIALVGALLGGCVLQTNEIETKVETAETKAEIVETVEIQKVKVFPQRYPDPVSEIKKEIHETKHWDEDCSDHTIQITQAEAEMLMKIAYAEAGGEGIYGQLRVMQVVYNRTKTEGFPDDIDGVIHQKSQFTSVTNGHYDNAEPTWETHMALALFEENNIHDDNLIGFETADNGQSLLSYFNYYDQLGNHVFYTMKKD